MKVIVFMICALLLSACTSELHHGLDESSANEMITLLERNGIEADKIPDPGDPKFWAVTVPHGVRIEAWSALQRQGLPRPQVEGFSQFYPREGLVPSADEERIIVQFATGQELRRALMAIDGVVDAHVNLVLPETPRVRLNRDELPPPRAAVLLKYRPDAAGKVPISVPEVQRLVAGAIDRMTPQQVEVVTTAIAVPVVSTNIKMTQVGPVSVAASNKTTLQALVGLLVIMVLGLAAGLSFVLVRRR